MNRILRLLRAMGWALDGRCDKCGGHISEHINGKFYCNDCHAVN